MPFVTLFIAHAPDADPEKHRAVVDTGLYKLFAVVARNQQQGVEVVKHMVAEEGVQSVLLCPGHTHKDVAEVAAAAGDQVSVSVARGDGPGSHIAIAAMEKAGWFNPSKA